MGLQEETFRETPRQESEKQNSVRTARVKQWIRRGAAAGLSAVAIAGGIGNTSSHAEASSAESQPSITQTVEQESSGDINQCIEKTRQEVADAIVKIYSNENSSLTTSSDNTYLFPVDLKSATGSDGRHTQYLLDTSMKTKWDGQNEVFDLATAKSVSVRVLSVGSNPADTHTVFGFGSIQSENDPIHPMNEVYFSYGDSEQDTVQMATLPGITAPTKKEYLRHFAQVKEVLEHAKNHANMEKVEMPQ